jgi:hypothetical protein
MAPIILVDIALCQSSGSLKIPRYKLKKKEKLSYVFNGSTMREKLRA